MIQFEVGKTYVSSECIKYTVIKRSDSFLTLQFKLQHSPVKTIRKKINIERDRERINLDNKYHYILANWIDDYHPSDVAPFKTSQPANNETAQQDTDSIKRFEVGKTYRGYTIVSRNDGRIGNLGSLWIVVTHNVDGISRPLHERRKAYSNTALNAKKGNSSEYFYEQNGRSPIFASEIDETDNTPDTNATVNAQHGELLSDIRKRSLVEGLSPNTGNIYPSQLHASNEDAAPAQTAQHEIDTDTETAQPAKIYPLTLNEAINLINTHRYTRNGYLMYTFEAIYWIVMDCDPAHLMTLMDYICGNWSPCKKYPEGYSFSDEEHQAIARKISKIASNYLEAISNDFYRHDLWTLTSEAADIWYRDSCKKYRIPCRLDDEITTTADTATLPEYTECPDDSYSDNGGDNSSPLQDTEIDHDSAATPETDTDPQNDSKKLPRLVSFYVNGYYLLPLEAEYMHYVHVIERSENTITVEDFANGDIFSLPVHIDTGLYTRSEYIMRPDGKGRARNGYADRDFLGFKRSEYPRHPVFEIGKSYSATREYLGEIYTLTFHVKKRVKLKHGKNDKYQNILIAGKMSGHPLENPIDFAVRLYWDKPSDPEHFTQDGFTFHAANPDETPAPVQDNSQPEHDDSNSDAQTLKLQTIPASTVNSIVKMRCAWEDPYNPCERYDPENLIHTADEIVKHNREILSKCPDDDIPALLATASQLTIAYMAWKIFDSTVQAKHFRKFFLIQQRKNTLINNFTHFELKARRKAESLITLVYVPDNNYPKPEYTQYPDTIPDDIPYHVIPAIDTPNPAAVITTLKPAGLPRVNAAVVRTWLHFVAFFIRLWLASSIRLSFSEAVPVIFPEMPRKYSLHKFTVNSVFFVSMGDGFTHYMTVIARGDNYVILEDFMSGAQYSLPVHVKDNSEWLQIGIFYGGLSAERDCRGKIATREHPHNVIFEPGIHYSAHKKKHNGDFLCRKILVVKRLRVLEGCKSYTLLHVKVSGDNINGCAEGVLNAYVVDGAENVGNDNDYFANARDALPFSETRSMKGNELHKAVHDNSASVFLIRNSDFLRVKLAGLSVNAIKKIGKCLGLLQQHEKGSAHALAYTLVDRLFKHRTEPAKNSSAQQQQQPKTYTDCNGQIVLIFD